MFSADGMTASVLRQSGSKFIQMYYKPKQFLVNHAKESFLKRHSVSFRAQFSHPDWDSRAERPVPGLYFCSAFRYNGLTEWRNVS